MSCSRRDVLRGGLALPLLSIGVGCRADTTPIYDAAVNDDPYDPRYGQVAVSLAEVSDLLLPGRAVTLRLAALPTVARERPFTLPTPPELLVVHRPEDRASGDAAWAAVESACPHAGCPLSYDAGDDQLACPCHDSRFRAGPVDGDLKSCTGQRLSGPAQQGPRAYATQLDAATQVLFIDLTTPAGCDVTRLPAVAGGKLTLSLTDYPDLGNVDGLVIGRPPGLAHDVAIVRVTASTDASAVAAVDPTCTHMRCTVGWSSSGDGGALCGTAQGGFICPCHCSRFASDGTVLVGPATQALRSFPVDFDGQTIVVTIS